MIGIFDSGSGGLTVLAAIRKEFPSVDVTYFGDIKNAPYGSRPQDELAALTARSIQLLTARGARTVVSACNSVSASLALSMLEVMPNPPERVIEMVGPTVKSLAGSSARLLLTATPAAVRSGIYKNAFSMVGKDITEVAIDGLAGAIEFGASEDEVDALIRTAFAGTDLKNFDALILACTHYPFVTDAFRRVLGDIPLIDPAEAVAARVYAECWPREVGDGTTTFLISKDSDRFRTLVTKMFPKSAKNVEVLE